MKVHNEVRRPLVRASVSTCFCAADATSVAVWICAFALVGASCVWISSSLQQQSRPDSQLVLLHLNTSAVLIASCLPHEPSGRRTAIMEGVGAAQALLPPFKL